MQVLSLYLYPTYGYNDVFRRSYKSHITQDGINALDNATRGGTELSPTAISQVATQLLSPSSEVDQMSAIVNGWRTERFYFVLKMLETTSFGNNNVVYYIGHTDRSYDAVSANGYIAQDLQFFVNAMHRLTEQNVNVGGMPHSKMIPKGGSQIIYGSSNLAQLDQFGVMDMWKMRPSEVFHSQNQLNKLESSGVLPSNYIDTTGSMISGAALSNRRNNTPGSYLYDTLKAYQGGLHAALDHHADSGFLADEALFLTRDEEVYQDPFFFNMQRIVQQMNERGQFSWKDLCTLAPYVDSVTVVFDNMEAQRARMEGAITGYGYDMNIFNNQWHAGNTASWHSSDIETVSAALLVNAIPTIMLENLISDLRISFTNMTSNGADAYQRYVVKSFAQGVDATVMLNRVTDRIIRELIPKISLQNNFVYTLLIDSSIVGETMVTININNGGERTYVMPTFADNGTSPVITSSQQHYNQFTNDMFNIGSMLFDKQVRNIMPAFQEATLPSQTYNANTGWPAPSPMPQAPVTNTQPTGAIPPVPGLR